MSDLDPIKLEIIRGAIRAAQAEMDALLERTAISAFIREKKDFYTALFDADGVMVVGSMVPIFGDITGPVFVRFPPETMRAGDLYWYSDCYASRGAVSHSNDQVFLAPVFHDGRRAAFVMGWAHFSDIGGLRPGSISSDATDIFQEGIIIPPTKLIDAGTVNQAALEIFHRNSRYPAQSRGDTRALMASVDLGVRRVAEIMQRFGPDMVADAFSRLFTRTRDLVRARLRETFAVGTHRFSDAIDSDGHGNGPFYIRLALTRTSDDRFILDATETDDQAPGPVNFLMNPDVPGMALGLFFLGGDPAQVCNAGGPRALDEVRLREGSLLWPRFPAPLGLRGMTMMRFLAVLNGLVNVAGGSAPAAHSAYVVIMLRGSADGKSFLMSDGVGVGYGARSTADGIDAVYFVAQENYPIEFLELGYPGAAAAICHSPRQRRAGAIPRRRGCRARIPGAGRACGAVDAHRQRGQATVGRRRRHARRHRSRRGQSRHAARTEIGPAVGRHRAAAWRYPAVGNRRRRRSRPSVRPAGRTCAAGLSRRICLGRSGASGLRRGDRRRDGGSCGDRRVARDKARRRRRSIARVMSMRSDDAHRCGRHRRHVHRRHAGRPCDRTAVAGEDAQHAGRSVGSFHHRRDARAATTPARGPLLSARVLHGTTVATNLILEGKGARTALVTTAGFRHVLEIGRQDIPRHANLYAWVKPQRPVPPTRVLEVIERVGAGGVVLTPHWMKPASTKRRQRCGGWVCRRSRSVCCTPSRIPRMSAASPRCCARRCRVSR